MLTSAVLVSLAASALAANYTLPSGFDINQVPSGERHSWCVAERNSCPQICGGVAVVNHCDPDSLNFKCQCQNGSNANVDAYKQTIPYFVCEANYGQCIARHPDDLEGQEQCKADAKCGTLDPTQIASHTDGATSAASATSSGKDGSKPTGPASSARQTTTLSAAATTATPFPVYKSSASVTRVAQDYSTIMLTAVLVAGLRLAL